MTTDSDMQGVPPDHGEQWHVAQTAAGLMVVVEAESCDCRSQVWLDRDDLTKIVAAYEWKEENP